jgi:hypothetical protein
MFEQATSSQIYIFIARRQIVFNVLPVFEFKVEGKALFLFQFPRSNADNDVHHAACFRDFHAVTVGVQLL